MNKLTEQEIESYVMEKNTGTGVDAITREYLETIDLNTVDEINVPPFVDGRCITNKDGKPIFKYDSFTPRAGSIYLKPSFAGSQVLMGRVGRKLYFSNGKWFSC